MIDGAVTHYLDYGLLRWVTPIYSVLRQIMADYGCYGNSLPLSGRFFLRKTDPDKFLNLK
jgi:hypothetical protein